MLVLASQSVARIRLLESAGLTFETAPHRVNESDYGSFPPPVKARMLAEAKAISLSDAYPEATIIGSDQVLQLEHEVLSKPKTRPELRRQLLRLRGRTHQLHTAVACACRRGITFSELKTVTLHMRSFSDAFLDDYLEKEGSALFGCVGGYKIEGRGLQLFSELPDDPYAVQGIPLLPLLVHLRETGILLT